MWMRASVGDDPSRKYAGGVASVAYSLKDLELLDVDESLGR